MSKKYLDSLEDYPEIPIGFAKDLRGETFGDFQVCYRTINRTKPSSAAWIVKCIKCGRYMYKGRSNWITGKNECPCKNHPLPGTIIQNKWEVGPIVVFAEHISKGDGKSCVNKFECKCLKCGKYQIISHRRFNDNSIIRCKNCEPLISSWGEEKVKELLDKNNIDYIYQKRFLNFNKYPFDFFIPNENLIIEIDGEQHFNNKGDWSQGDKTHENDLLKNKYCFENNISIIRIPYDVEWTYKDLFLETTRFLLTPENEDEYYSLRMEEK